MQFILLGEPGAGKGTYSAVLIKKFQNPPGFHRGHPARGGQGSRPFGIEGPGIHEKGRVGSR